MLTSGFAVSTQAGEMRVTPSTKSMVEDFSSVAEPLIGRYVDTPVFESQLSRRTIKLSGSMHALVPGRPCHFLGNTCVHSIFRNSGLLIR